VITSLLLSFGLLPAASATNDCAFIVRQCQEDTDSVIHVMPTRSTTVTHCCMASLAVWSNGCSGYRTRQHDSSLELVDVTTSLQCWDSFVLAAYETKNWFQVSGAGFASSYLSEDSRLVTKVGRRHIKSLNVHTCTVPRTESQIGDRNFTAAGPCGYGTACKLKSDGKTLLLNIIGGYFRRICSFRLQCIVTFFYLTALDISTYTYSLIWDG